MAKNEEVKIDINVESNTKGAKDAAKDIRAVGEATKETTDGVKSIASATNEAVAGLQSIGDASDGANKAKEAIASLRDTLEGISQGDFSLDELLRAKEKLEQLKQSGQATGEEFEKLTKVFADQVTQLDELGVSGDNFESIKTSISGLIGGLDTVEAGIQSVSDASSGLSGELANVAAKSDQTAASLDKISVSSSSAEQAKFALETLRASLQQISEGGIDGAALIDAKDQLDQLRESGQATGEEFKALTVTFAEQVDQLDKLGGDGDKFKDLRDSVGGLTEGLGNVEAGIQSVADASSGLAEGLSDVTEKSAEAVDELQKIKELNIEAGRLGGEGDYEAAAKLREEARKLYAEYLNLEAGADAAGDAITGLKDKTEVAAEPFRGLETAVDSVGQKLAEIRALNEQAGLLGASGDFEAAQKLRDEASKLYDEYVKLGEATELATKINAGFNEETIRSVEATEQLKEVIEEINEVKEDSVEINVEAKEALEQYVEQAEDAVDAFEDEAKAAQKMNKEIEKIRAIQQAQLLGEFARGLRDIARAAEDNGLPELAAGLSKTATAFRTTATVIQGGLGISQLISQLGGLKASLAAVATFLTGPLGIALGVAAAAYIALEFAVKKASDEMDRFIEEQAKPLDGFEKIKEASNEAFDALSKNIDKETKAIQKVIDKRDEELVKIRQKTNELTAQVDQEEAIASAQVDAQLATGDISEVEALTAKRDIAIKFENERQVAAQNARNAAYRESLKAFEKNEETVKGLLSEREEIQKRLNLGNFTKLNPEAKKQFDEVTNKIAELADEKRLTLKILPLSSLGDYGEAKNLQEEINELYREADEILSASVEKRKLNATKELEAVDAELVKRQESLEAQGKQLEALKGRLQSEQNIALITFETFKVQKESSTAIAAQNKIASDNAKARLEIEKQITAETKKREKEDKKIETDRTKVEGDLTTAAKKVEGIAEGLGAEGGIDPQGFQRLQLAVAKLEDGVTTGEATEIGVLINSLSGYIIKQSEADLATKERIRQLNEKIKSLASQVKNNRPKN